MFCVLMSVELSAQDIIITSQPHSIKECVGNSASLSVSTYSLTDKLLTFHWYKDNSTIHGENYPVLKFQSLQHNQSGNYYCEISNSKNESIKTNPVSVYALTSTSISKQPEDVMTSLSSEIVTLKFEAHVSGLEIDEAIQTGEFVNIQWFRLIDNSNIKLTNDEIFDGINSSQLSINIKNLPDTTYYFAEIEGKCGKVLTRTVKVIKNLSIIQLEIADLDACEGNIESLKAQITNPHNHNLEFQWYKDGKPIYYKENLKGIFSEELIFNPIYIKDAGKYKLQAIIKEMDYSVFSNEIDVTLCSKPVIIAIRIDSITSVSFAYKKAFLQIFYKRNCQSIIDVYKDDSLFVSSDLKNSDVYCYNTPDSNFGYTSFLEFDKSELYAKYRVVIHNRCGYSLSDTITVSEHFNDFTNRDPFWQYRELCEGDSTTIQFYYAFFKAKRNYNLRYQWRTNARIPIGDSRYYIGYQTNILHFKNLRKEDAGLYWLEGMGNITNNPDFDTTYFVMSSGFVIKIKPSPDIKTQPFDRTIQYGDKDTIINIIFNNEPQEPISVELYYMASLNNSPRLIDKSEAEYGMWYRYVKDITFAEDGYYYAVTRHDNDCKPVISDTVRVTVIPNGGTTSVLKFESNSGLLIQHNPSSDFITIQFSNTGLQLFAAEEKVQIFDVLGIEVGQSSLIVNDTNNNSQSGMIDLLRIDVSHLPAGTYFIRLGNKVEKFVKM